MITLALLLLALPLATAIIFLFLANQKTINILNVIGGIATTTTALVVAWKVFSQGTIIAYKRFIYIDALSAYIIIIVAIIGLLSGLYSIGYTGHEVKAGELPIRRLKIYFFLFYIFIFTMLAVVITNNLGIMWVAIEATTLASALLVAFYDHKSSLEAAWKYVLICTVGIIFALLGTILLYYAAVSISGEGSATLNISNLIALGGRLDPKLLKLAFIFILVGYGTKAGLAPMHTWLPDAHSQSPSPISAMLSGVLLNCALYGILRFHLIVSKSLGEHFSANLLIIFGLLSIAVSLPFIIVQHDIKRLLAYSSVEHMGIIVTAVGIGGRLALYGAFLHMLNHALTKTSLFFGAGNITQKYRTKKIHKIKGVIKAMPITGPSFLIGALAITGVPALGIFISEFTILSAGFAQGKYLYSGLMLLLITVIFTGFIYSVSKMTLGSPPGKIKIGEDNLWSAFFVLMPLIPVFILGIYMPPFLENILGQVVSVMIGGN